MAFKRFVKRAHQQGIAVILDVVYNHLGPSDLDMWQFDGWSENKRGGIYFYNDDRAHTPWGDTRPAYGHGEVRQYLRDNVFMWLEEYHVDGLRFDGTVYIRTVHGSSDQDLPEGWSLLPWLNGQITQHFRGRITIAEDLQNNPWLTKDIGAGGAGFGAQWDANFVHPIRQAVITPEDAQRSLLAIRDALCYRYNDDAFARVIHRLAEGAHGARGVSGDHAHGPRHVWLCERALHGRAPVAECHADRAHWRGGGGSGFRDRPRDLVMRVPSPTGTLFARFQHLSPECHRWGGTPVL